MADGSKLSEIEGRLRALEALVLEMDISEEQIARARETLRDQYRSTHHSWKATERLKGPEAALDQDGEQALSSLKFKLAKAASARSPAT